MTLPVGDTAVGSTPLLEVDDLRVRFGKTGTVVDGVSFTVGRGEVVGLAGESGSGKTMTALAVDNLLPAQAVITGSVRFGGTQLVGLPEKRLRSVRGQGIGHVFQEAMSCLHPAKRVGKQVAEAVRAHTSLGKTEARERAVELLHRVGIPHAEQCARQYPHELSGGLQQRVGIAIALAGQPDLLIADEPTTALDTTVQAQIMDLLRELQEALDLAVVFISHDLALISELCQRVIIMYSGEIVEQGPIAEVFATPAHPYTERLLDAVVRLGTVSERPPSLPDAGGSGCRFAPRCPYAEALCDTEPPPLGERRSGVVRCHRHQQLALAGVDASAEGEP